MSRKLLEECLHTCMCHAGEQLERKIRAELAKPDEPAAWECTRGGFVELTIVHPSRVWGNGFKNVKPLYAYPPVQQKPEPVAWRTTDLRPKSLFTENEVIARGWGLDNIPFEALYTHLPAQEPEPLTRDEIDSILNECVELEGYYDNARGESKRWVLKDEHKFATAIEQAVWSKMK